MADLTDIITQELPTKAAREEFTHKAREIRDSYDVDGPEGEASDASARQWLVWNRIALAAQRLVSAAPT